MKTLKLIIALLVLLVVSCGDHHNPPPPQQNERFVIEGISSFPENGTETDFQFSLTGYYEPMLTLPAQFKTQLLKKNTPSYIVKMVESEIQNEQTSQGQWAANSGYSQMKWTSPVVAGDVQLDGGISVGGIWTQKTSGATARNRHTANFYNGKMYVFGGMDSTLTKLNDIWEYTPNNDQWTQKTSGATIRYGHSSVIHNGKIYIFGGSGASSCLNDVWEYDISGNSWTQKFPTGGPPPIRYMHSAVVHNGKMYVFGGALSTAATLSDIWELDLNTFVWTQKTSDPVGIRAYHTSVVYNDKIYIYGGSTTGSNYLGDVREYNIVDDSWSAKTSGVQKALHKADTFFGKMYVFGGYNGSFLNDVYEYNIATDTWIARTAGATARGEHSFVFNSDGRAYVFGGTSGIRTNTIYEDFLAYYSSGYIRTQTIDFGSAPTVDGIWRFQNLIPLGTSITYEAWASDTGLFAGEEESLGFVTSNQAITVRKRYYRVKATHYANTALDTIPTLQSIMARFPIYIGYSDNPRLGYEAALLSVSALSQTIDDFKATSVGQVQGTFALTKSMSNYLATAYPKNKEAKILLGFLTDSTFDLLSALQQVYVVSSLDDMLQIFDSLDDIRTIHDFPMNGFAETDYLLYYTGIIKDWNIGENDTVTVKIDDLHIEWDAPVPRKWVTAADDKTWIAVHPVDAIIDIVQGYVTSTTDIGALLRGYTSLDYDSLNTVKLATPGWTVTRTITGRTEKARDLLEELRQLLFAYFLPKSTGNIFLKRWNASEIPAMSLTDRDFLTKKWDSNAASLMNLCAIYFNWIASVEEPTWYLSTAYKKGDYVLPSASKTGFRYECTTAGTSAGSEPAWPTSVGNTVVDNTATWTCRNAAQDNDLKNYLTSSITSDPTSINNWKEVAVKELKDKWTRTAQISQVQNRGMKLLTRYANPPEKLSVSTDMRFFELEVGDIVNVTTERAPTADLYVTLRQIYDISCLNDILQAYDSLDDVAAIFSLNTYNSTTDMGIIEKPFQVIKKTPDFKTYKINFDLLRV